MNLNNLKLYFEWDIISWSRAMRIWRKYLEINRGNYALEIGGRRGSISLMLAKEYDMKVIRSDINNPGPTAELLHDKYSLKHKIEYKAVDCTEIVYEDNTFDVVLFKSVIGALGSVEKQMLAFQEIQRVLKPGGVLLFAENLKSSALHMYLRRKFVVWSTYWRYPELKDIYIYTKEYNHIELNTTGFFANLISNHFVRVIFSYFDLVFEKILPKKLRYIVYGAAIK